MSTEPLAEAAERRRPPGRDQNCDLDKIVANRARVRALTTVRL